MIGRNCVELRSYLMRRKVISALKEADLMILTSDWEASPLVILESMAAGIPWVSLDVGCVREHVGGVIVKDIKEMAEAVSDLLRNTDKRHSLSVEGRRRVEQCHDWETIVGRYEALYQELVEGR